MLRIGQIGLVLACALHAQLADPLAAQDRSASAADARRALQQALDRFRESAGFPGGTCTILFADGSSASVASGVSDPRTKRAMRVDDRMLAGSMGKMFVAATTLKLVEQGKLRLDEPIKTWLGERDWFARVANHERITLRMLLNHTSGIPDHLRPALFKELPKDPDRIWKAAELIAFILDEPALFEAGSNWSYSDTNYIFVGAIIELVMQRDFYTLAGELCLRPFELTGTLPQDSRTIPRLVTGRARAGAALGIRGYTVTDGRFLLNPQFEWTGGGFVSTADDLAKWVRLLYGGKVLKPETMRQMLNGTPARTGPNQKYGLGVQIRESPLGTVYYHGGWFPGYMGETAYYHEAGVSIAILVNADHNTRPSTFQKFFDATLKAILKP